MMVYMVVSRDKYELPMIVADTVGELARFQGVKKETIYQRMSHRKGKKSIYVKVDIGDEEKTE